MTAKIFGKIFNPVGRVSLTPAVKAVKASFFLKKAKTSIENKNNGII